MESMENMENMENAEATETKKSYRDSAIDERIIRAVEEMGFESMTPIQEQAIPIMLDGKDLIGQAQTGTGKTAAFGIPIIQKIDPEEKGLQAIILCPTRELAMQAAEEIRRFAKYMHEVKVLPVYGGQDISRQIRALSKGVQIVVGTPGRVMDHMRRHTLKTGKVRMVVLDEADEMLNMGFREDIETILKDMPEERQTALFSATMPKPILEITKEYQKEDAEYLRITPKEVTIPLVKQAYYQVPRKEKEEVLTRLMDYYHPKRSLIFCNTKRMVDELTEHLKDRGYQAEGLHGDLTQHQRDTVMNLFRGGRMDVLIATDVAARGIDVDDVEAVFNYDVPEDIEYYVHRIGRTGRAGKTGRSFTLVSGKELYKIRDIERVCHTKIRERNIPSAADITSVKAEKILGEALETMQNKNLDSTIDFLREKLVDGEYTALELAAAFMKMKMGDDIKDIKVEKFNPKDLVFGRGGSKRGKRGGRGRSSERDKSRRGGEKERSREKEKSKEKEAAETSSIVRQAAGSWGLSFQEDGKPPVADVSAQELAKYTAYYMEET
ncbi:MAG: DEAD/DEAH box helicase, partial [Kineothrix sp.]|nr:DEAD/DEAH box helicase [Kineothrix sp.]